MIEDPLGLDLRDHTIDRGVKVPVLIAVRELVDVLVRSLVEANRPLLGSLGVDDVGARIDGTAHSDERFGYRPNGRTDDDRADGLVEIGLERTFTG